MQAKAALEAAIRNEADLRELLEPPKAPQRSAAPQTDHAVAASPPRLRWATITSREKSMPLLWRRITWFASLTIAVALVLWMRSTGYGWPATLGLAVIVWIVLPLVISQLCAAFVLRRMRRAPRGDLWAIIAVLLLLLGFLADRLVRVENQRYALAVGMCKVDPADPVKQWMCLDSAQTRTSWFWHLYYAATDHVPPVRLF